MSGGRSRELLRIFPLSSTVLFPGAPLPLQIFEPRYLQMIEEALAGDRRVGMVSVRPESLGELAGDPPIFAVGCAGEIRWSERQPGGEYRIVLVGTRRFRVASEPSRPPAQLFRRAEVEWLDDPLAPEDADRIAALRAEVLELIHLLGVRRGGGLGELVRLGRHLLQPADHRRFVNLLAQVLPFDPVEKRQLLESDSVLERAEGLLRCIQVRVAEREARRSGSPRSVH